METLEKVVKYVMILLLWFYSNDSTVDLEKVNISWVDAPIMKRTLSF